MGTVQRINERGAKLAIGIATERSFTVLPGERAKASGDRDTSRRLARFQSRRSYADRLHGAPGAVGCRGALVTD
jgi:hypothetical protein